MEVLPWRELYDKSAYVMNILCLDLEVCENMTRLGLISNWENAMMFIWYLYVLGTFILYATDEAWSRGKCKSSYLENLHFDSWR